MIETKLVDILDPFELEDHGDIQIQESKKGGVLTMLNLVPSAQETKPSKSVVNPYDMGGHSPYYCSQKVNYILVWSVNKSHNLHKINFKKY